MLVDLFEGLMNLFLQAGQILKGDGAHELSIKLGLLLREALNGVLEVKNLVNQIESGVVVVAVLLLPEILVVLVEVVVFDIGLVVFGVGVEGCVVLVVLDPLLRILLDQ